MSHAIINSRVRVSVLWVSECDLIKGSRVSFDPVCALVNQGNLTLKKLGETLVRQRDGFIFFGQNDSSLSLHNLRWHLVSGLLPSTLKTLFRASGWSEQRGCPHRLSWLGWSGDHPELSKRPERRTLLVLFSSLRDSETQVSFLSWIKLHLILSGCHFLESSTGWGFGTNCTFSSDSLANNENSYYQLGFKHKHSGMSLIFFFPLGRYNITKFEKNVIECLEL